MMAVEHPQTLTTTKNELAENDPYQAKIPAKVTGSARAGPRRTALVMEKSHAFWSPLGPGDPDVGRTTGGVGGIKQVPVWWSDHRQRGPGGQEACFFQDSN